MEPYAVSYRDEFGCTVQADSEEEAIEKAQQESKWECIGELHSGLLQAELAE